MTKCVVLCLCLCLPLNQWKEWKEPGIVFFPIVSSLSCLNSVIWTQKILIKSFLKGMASWTQIWNTAHELSQDHNWMPPWDFWNATGHTWTPLSSRGFARLIFLAGGKNHHPLRRDLSGKVNHGATDSNPIIHSWQWRKKLNLKKRNMRRHHDLVSYIQMCAYVFMYLYGTIYFAMPLTIYMYI